MAKITISNKLWLIIALSFALVMSFNNLLAADGHGGGGYGSSGGHGGGGHGDGGRGSYGGHGGGGRGHYYYRGGGGRGHYYYRGGRWYNSGWFWGSFATGLAIGTIVRTLPPYYEVVYVNGFPYYYYDSVYYRSHSSGYIVVPAPASNTVVVAPATTAVVTVPTVTQTTATSGETIVINIPNASGGYTPVILTKHKTGYIGPQGEYYEGHPNVEQLRVLYGK